MFREITLKNYRTHKLTTIKLKPVTLLIGNNNSGKTNFLAGIQHFCTLVRRGRPDRSAHPTVHSNEYFPHRYILAEEDEPIAITIKWDNPDGGIDYDVELYKNRNFRENTGCREKITIRLTEMDKSKEVSSGYDQSTDCMALRKKIESESSLHNAEKGLCRAFFRDFAYTFSYHFQPSFLKGMVQTNDADRSEETEEGRGQVRIPADLRSDGRNLQKMLHHVKEKEEHIYSRFAALMRSFENNFHGIRYDTERSQPQLIWELLGPTDRPPEKFVPGVISDGLMKAAAIALLASLERPPALILLEEVENGINPGNIQKLMSWIWQTTAPNQEGYAPQFILTSHSPSVLREFHDHLDHVYTFRLDKRRLKSDVINLNEALDVLVRVGTVEGDIDEDSGLVTIPESELPSLWYSGTIG